MRNWSVLLRLPVYAVTLSVVMLASLAGNTLLADQQDPALPELFQQLEETGSHAQSRELEAEIWKIWLQTDDAKSEVLLNRVVDSMEVADLDEALIASNELIDVNPEFAEAWNKRATVHYLMGNYPASVEDIHRTLQLEPRHFGAISGLGLIFIRTGNLNAALEAFEQVLIITPQSINAQRSVEQVKQQIGEEI